MSDPKSAEAEGRAERPALDLEPIKAELACTRRGFLYRRHVADGHYRNAKDDLSLVIAEVERLREVLFAWLVNRGVWFSDVSGPIDQERYEQLRTDWNRAVLPPPGAPKDHP